MRTNWKKNTCLGMLLCGILSMSCVKLAADTFEDFIQSCATVSQNYKRARTARESDYSKEFRMYMKTMISQSAEIQFYVEKMALGKDFNFRDLCRELEKIFWEDKTKRYGKNNNVSAYPDGVLKILLFDAKELHKMNFTTDDGGSIKITLERKRKLLEMERLVRFFRQFRSADIRNTDPSLSREFTLRCRRMQILAGELTERFQHQHPQASVKTNLHREVVQLLTIHSQIRENLTRQYSVRAETSRGKTKYRYKKKKSQNIKKMRKNDTPAALNLNTSQALRNIQTILGQWEAINFMTDGSLQKKTAGRSSGEEEQNDAAVLKKDHPENLDYNSLSQADLHRILVQMRTKIIKGNTSLDGFDSASERKFLQTLTREQKKFFTQAVKYNKDQGYESAIAVRSAVLKTQFEINMSKKLPEKKELVRILENIRKDQIRSKGKISF